MNRIFFYVWTFVLALMVGYGFTRPETWAPQTSEISILISIAVVGLPLGYHAFSWPLFRQLERQRNQIMVAGFSSIIGLGLIAAFPNDLGIIAGSHFFFPALAYVMGWAMWGIVKAMPPEGEQCPMMINN